MKNLHNQEIIHDSFSVLIKQKCGELCFQFKTEELAKNCKERVIKKIAFKDAKIKLLLSRKVPENIYQTLIY